MELNSWTKSLEAVYDKAVILYRDGKRDDSAYFTDDEKSFLASVGLRPINVYDYAEDFVTGGEPDWETFLLIAAARRDYFLFEQKGVASPAEIRADQLPSKRATLDGIPGCREPFRKPAPFWKEHSAMISCMAAAETGTSSGNMVCTRLTSSGRFGHPKATIRKSSSS